MINTKATEQLNIELKTIEMIAKWLNDLQSKFPADEVANLLYYELCEESCARRLEIAERQLKLNPDDVLARFIVDELKYRF